MALFLFTKCTERPFTMDHLGKIALFKDVVDCQSFSKAAIKRGLTHSTVSKHIKRLEELYDVRLLLRNSRTMSLTEPGRSVYNAAVEIQRALGNMESQLQEQSGLVVGELKVTCLFHLAPHLVQPAIDDFLKTHPQASVKLVLNDSPLAFSRDGFDAAIRVGLIAEGRLTARKIIDNEVILVAAPSLLEHHGSLSHPNDLAKYPTVTYVSGNISVDNWLFEEDGEIRSVRVYPRLTVNDGNALLAAARQACGVAYVTKFSAQTDLKRGDLVRVLPEFSLPNYAPVYLLTAPQEFPSPKVKAFKECLIKVAKALNDDKLNK